MGECDPKNDPWEPPTAPEVVGPPRPGAHQGSCSEAVEDVPLPDPGNVALGHQTEGHPSIPKEFLVPQEPV